jgi:hypothetical protein
MQLKLIRHLWGETESPAECFPRFARHGYHGIEAVPPPEGTDRDSFIDLLAAHDFDYIAQIHSFDHDGPVEPSVAAHVDRFGRLVELAASYHPLLINTHSGFDGWTFDQAADYFTQAIAIENQFGIPVAHETHRKCVFYNPWSTRAIVERFPGLKLCADFSHWVNVCERLIDDQLDILSLCAERTIHLHTRVGFCEGPQVPDPRAPHYARELTAHERWWDLVWDAQQQRGMSVTTLVPEFGPPPYLHVNPDTQQPLADLDEICNWMALRQAERFNARSSPGSPAPR